MRRTGILWTFIISLIILTGLWRPDFADSGDTAETLLSIPFGTLPVLQALPLFVASELGFFSEEELDVTLIPFNSAMEKDVAVSAGEILGYFGDVVTPLVLSANHIPVRIVGTSFRTTGKQRMFAILSSPSSKGKTLRELLDGGIACSSNTIIEYVTFQMLRDLGVSHDGFKIIETKNIPIRLQMLLSNQVRLATLPEPLVSLAELKGAEILIDDAGKDFSVTVLAFQENFLTREPDAIRRFLKAHNKAADRINQDPEKTRPIMNRYCRIPLPLQEGMPIPYFPPLEMPGEKQMYQVYSWLRAKDMIKTNLTYSEMVVDGFLP